MNIILETLADNVTLIRLSGRIDSQTVPEINAALEPLLVDECRLLVDMEGVTYMSSAGLRTLLVLYQSVETQRGRVVMAGVNEHIQDIMAMTGFLDHFELRPTLQQGLATLQET